MNKDAMISSASSSVAGAKIIMNSEGVDHAGQKWLPSLPVILISAFSIEVSLKFLLEEQGFKKTHDLSVLFDELSERAKDQILDLFVVRDPNTPKLRSWSNFPIIKMYLSNGGIPLRAKTF